MMKKIKHTILQICSLGCLIFILSCERDLSDDAVFATFPNTPGIFDDTFIGMGSNFYFPYAGSKATAFSVDENEGFESRASIRFDVPNANDPDGNFAGAIFRIDGSGRDLSQYDALTFYARASQSATISEFGFGEDFGENRFLVSLQNVQLTTAWQKIIVPIPNALRLTNEIGMFRYSASGIGPQGNELGYSIWVDDLKFETLGTLAQPSPSILGGVDVTQQTFNGGTFTLTNLTQTFNSATQGNITLSASPAYFDFSSSNIDVAQVSELGVVNVVSSGTATITASLGNVLANGSLEVNSIGDLPTPPTPTLAQNQVASIYSDAYTSATNVNFNPGFGGSTTQTSEATLNNNSVLIYNNNNFTGIIFDNTVDASSFTMMHVDVYTANSALNLEFQIRDIGTDGEIDTDVFTGLPNDDDADFRFTTTGVTAGSWTSFDIPLAGDLTTQRNNLGAIILANGPDFILDNIYFY